MADEKPPTESKPKFTWKDAQAKLERLEAHLTSLEGKEKVNPFFFRRDNLVLVHERSPVTLHEIAKLESHPLRNDTTLAKIAALPEKPDCKVYAPDSPGVLYKETPSGVVVIDQNKPIAR